ncbi:Hypothetical predicted protein [Octopus vulgaris]|uniref:Uncharacterized protein n=1 Tax=Octopus vulgaris TaxID=6645 RepID=A0AA36AWD1_OCTVU|nr:Hypothetical predicted protein [Octopus vulgaris]
MGNGEFKEPLKLTLVDYKEAFDSKHRVVCQKKYQYPNNIHFLKFSEYQYPNRMESQKRHSYAISYKLKQEDELQQTEKWKYNLKKPNAKKPELENELKTWVADNQNKGLVVSTKAIIFHAKVTAAARDHYDFSDSFHEKKNGLTIHTKTRIAQKILEEYENKILEFHHFVIRTRQCSNYELCHIANMDKVSLIFDVPLNRTVDAKGSKKVTIKTIGHEKKTHYTVVLACCTDGMKLPPLLIFKRKPLPKDCFPSGVVIHIHPSFMTFSSIHPLGSSSSSFKRTLNDDDDDNDDPKE